ncbi:MAG: DAK2 domain-containing protein [Chloroflexi bacterium]|nr:DAK2 domain-containing protein [Chloroflexota bacterium]
MKQISSISGQELRDMFATATGWLEKSAAEIDALNVFPVPDGDTGTNMLLTMRSTVEESYRAPDHSAAGVANAMARGALMGARGNSGVILSQFWRGLAQGLNGKDAITARDLADAFQRSTEAAYKGLTNPVEGTILTVIKDAAAAARAKAAAEDADVVSVMEAAVEAAAQSVADTPRLLKVLRDSGVVDAGGQGLYTILDGALRHLRGEAAEMRFRKSQIIVNPEASAARLPQMVGADEVPYGYCTEFMIKGTGLSPERTKKRLRTRGESLIVVGDDTTIRVHIHSLDPGSILRYGTRLGTVHQISVRNMDEQHQDFLEMQKDKAAAGEISIVAVVAGDGMEEVFSSLGAVIVPGGQTMNPSTRDLLQAVESVPSEKVIILPNNKNIVLTARQVPSLTGKTVEVVPAETVPQGVAALLAFDYEAKLQTNVRIMTCALSSVKSIEITRSVRSTRLGDIEIKKGQPIGLLDGDLVAAGNDNLAVVNDVLSRIDMEKAGIVTIYRGGEAGPEEAEALSASIRERFPQLQIEIVRGDQPHYDYIISIE